VATDYGARIKRRRQELGWTQAELAARIGKGVHVSTIANWEHGKHSPERHQGAIEAVLGISLDPADEPEIYTDPREAELWSLTSFTPDERREMIRAYRAKRLRRAG
jgi:ribosome-binding protein aMBF1 (putative translation factor)